MGAGATGARCRNLGSRVRDDLFAGVVGEVRPDEGHVVDAATLDFLMRRLLSLPMSYFSSRRIGDILAQRQHVVLEAGEGLEAVRILAQALRAAETRPAERVSLVILDLNMPGLIDGFQTLGVLKAMDEDLPVLILTASAPTPELLRKLGQLKARKYLNKSSKNLDELLLRNLETV